MSQSITIENQQVHLKVSNSILGNNTTKKGMGTGIKNVQKRLDLQYKNRHKLLINNELNTFTIILQIDL
jgi:LytS/YehU family sensor histidine kinase